jgi:hypothetical protein
MRSISCKVSLVIVVLLSSCLSNGQASQTQTPVMISTSVPVATLTATTIPAHPSSSCVGTQTELPASMNGSFVLSGDYWLPSDPSGVEFHRTPSYILTVGTNTRREIPKVITDGQILDFSVSPDKKVLAYYTEGINPNNNRSEFKNNRLVLISGNGEKIVEYYNQSLYWWGLIGWLDNERLLISRFVGTDVPYPTIIFDPLNAKTEELAPNYPEIYTRSTWLQSWDEYSSVEAVYNPDLSLVIYLKNPSRIVLWDRQSEKIVTEIDVPGASSSPPLWQLNGRQFIIDIAIDDNKNYPPREELVSINADGEIKRLTRLLDSYKYVEIDRYSESADGKYIAFWFHHASYWPPSTRQFQLAIYNTLTEQTKIYCVETRTEIHPPIWAPTQNQLLVAGYLDSIENYGTVFVDVENGILSLVEKGVIPVGWMLDP